MRIRTRVMAALSPLIVVAFLFFVTPATFAGTDTWIGNSSVNLGDLNNWSPAAVPVPGDSLVFGSAGSSGASLNNNLTSGQAIDGITFGGGSAFTITGNGILLSASNSPANVGVANTSGVTQTLGVPLALDWGYFTFTSSGGGLALNGGLTINAGGVAYFDANNTSTALTLDGTTGLITGLEGNGLMYDGVSAPTGLATLSGSSIVAYSSYTAVASGAIPSGAGNNLNLTATGATGTYTANNSTANTISVAQAGGGGGADFTSTLTVTGTLTLGQNGGIYVLNSTGTNHANFSLAGGTLTAGTSGPASINFCINGANQNNQAAVSSTIVNNTGGGAVRVIKSGTGTMNFATTTTSSYTGGVFVDQGQLQFGQVQQLGTGPVCISSNATLYCTSTSALVVSNNLFINPGNGASDAALQNGQAGAFIYSGGYLFSNAVITLQGAPVSYPTPGNRFSSEAAVNLGIYDQVTGTGTLEICGAHSTIVTLQNPNSSGPSANNWSGGVILDATSGHAVNVDLKLGAAGNMPSGTNAGNVTLVSAEGGIYARFDLNGFNATIAGLNGSSGAVSNQLDNSSTTPCTVTIGANNANGNFTGSAVDTATGTLGIVKIGSGTQIFNGTVQGTGSSTFGYHGNTTISNGTLALSGNAFITNTPTISITAPATLDVSGTSGLTLGASQALNAIGTVIGNVTVGGTVNPFFGSVGTLTITNAGNSAQLSLSGGGSYVWDINNATGTQGGDPGWGLLNVDGSLQINATSGSQFVIKITSLTNDVAGNAANFNPNVSGSWIIASASGGISGFTGPNQFAINTSAFSNAPTSASQWSAGVSGNNLVLTYTAFNLITTAVVNKTNNAGTTASFTEASTTGIQPVSFTWFQGVNQLFNGGSSASGGTVTITTNGPGTSSTLSIANVQDADAGGITVQVADNASHTGSSSATLTVIDPPSNVNVVNAAPSQNTAPVSAGAVNLLTAFANGSTPFTYQWYLGTNAISGATNSSYSVNISPATLGSYTVVISNPAGSATNSSPVVITGPISVVPNQIIFEPFNYPGQSHPASPPGAWTAFGVTNVYNQVTGNGLAWLSTGSDDFTTDPSGPNTEVDPYTVAPYGIGTRPIVNDEYPVTGLAGYDGNVIYADSDLNGGQANLPFGTGGTITNGKVYFSTVIMLWGMNQTPTAFYDYVMGLDSGASNSTTHSVGIYIQENTAATYPNVPYTLGIFKGNLTTSQLSPGTNGNWSPNTFLDYNVLFVVGRINFQNSPATVDLWINPPASSYYASEANLPTADVANAAGGVADVSGGVSSFYMKITQYPVDRYFSDLRIGTTWASVTPPSAPTFLLGNVYAPIGTTAVFAAQNAGNPVTGGYGWQFNNGSPLSDGPTGHGSTISGSSTATLTISNVQAADLGIYTITATNTSPAPSDSSANLVGSASAILSGTPPKLSVVMNGSNATILWETNWLGYVLESSPAVTTHSAWTTNSLPPYAVFGTNNGVVVPASSGNQFFRLINP